MFTWGGGESCESYPSLEAYLPFGEVFLVTRIVLTHIAFVLQHYYCESEALKASEFLVNQLPQIQLFYPRRSYPMKMICHDHESWLEENIIDG